MNFYILLLFWCWCSDFIDSKPNKFKSIPTTVKTRENDTVLLPCYVDQKGKYFYFTGK